MRNRKFTPPTEFPADGSGIEYANGCVVLGRRKAGGGFESSYVGYLKRNYGLTQWYDNGLSLAPGGTSLEDLPKVRVRYRNVFEFGSGGWWDARDSAVIHMINERHMGDHHLGLLVETTTGDEKPVYTFEPADLDE